MTLDALKEFVKARCDEDGVLPAAARAAIRRIATGWSVGFADSVTASEAEAAASEKLRALRHLASIWSDHSDFDPEWAFASSGLDEYLAERDR